jgi:mRNA interferase MazF
MFEVKPPRIKPILNRAPKIREIYWCDFWEDARLPEMWKRRPVVIISYKNELEGAVTLLPCSTSTQDRRPFSYQLEKPFDANISSVLCNYPITLAVSRLVPFANVIPRIDEKDFEAILTLMHKWLPQLKA